jgi:hypothetical protein
MDPVAPYETTLATVAAGRAAAVAELRRLADRLAALPLDTVAEVLVLLEPTLDDLRRQAALALERARRALVPPLATRPDPLVPADRAAAMEVVAAHPTALAVEHHVGPHASRAARTDRACVRERREVGLLDGLGRHAIVYHNTPPDRSAGRPGDDARLLR